MRGQDQEARVHLRRGIAAHPDLPDRADDHADAEHQQEPRLELRHLVLHLVQKEFRDMYTTDRL